MGSRPAVTADPHTDDEADRDPAPERQVHLRTCPLCEAMCGLEIHVRDEQVELIRADRDDVWSKGYLCPKGTTLGHLHHDPDRLRAPMIRQPDGSFREATLGRGVRPVRRAAAPGHRRARHRRGHRLRRQPARPTPSA